MNASSDNRNPYPIDPTGPLTIGTIPDAAELLVAAVANAEQSWRSLTDQLTPEQVATIERTEQDLHGVCTHPQAQQVLYKQAADMARLNIIDAQYADVPLPAGAATDSESWSENSITGQWNRSVEWASFDTGIDGVAVLIDGMQTTDGAFTRDVALYAEDVKLTAVQARELAAVLIAAADELDSLAGDL